MTLVIRLSGDRIRIFRDERDRTGQSFRDTLVWGPQTRYAVRDASRQGCVVGVQFRPGMAGAILRIAPAEVADRFVSLGDLWGARARCVRDQIGEAATPLDAIAAAQRILTPEVDPLLPNDAVRYALTELARDPAPAVEAVRLRTGYGPKRFIELFTTTVGMGPKCYSRLMRFQHVLKRANARPIKPQWAGIAADTGYADQAHLIHEFRALTGLTPRLYRPLEQLRPCHVALPEA